MRRIARWCHEADPLPAKEPLLEPEPEPEGEPPATDSEQQQALDEYADEQAADNDHTVEPYGTDVHPSDVKPPPNTGEVTIVPELTDEDEEVTVPDDVEVVTRPAPHDPADADVVNVFLDDGGGWRWNRVAANGRKIATSGEAFVDKGNAQQAAYRANPDTRIENATVKVVTQEPDEESA